MVEFLLLAVAILLPACSAACCYFIRKAEVRKIIVAITAFFMFAVSIGFVLLLLKSSGTIVIQFENETLGLLMGSLIKILDLALLIYIVFLGFRLKKPMIVVLSLFQLVPLVIFEVFGSVHEPENAFVMDSLSLIMVLLVSVIGSVITVFAIGYMREHEHHLHLKVSRQPRFFAILFIFLAAMNALVITNDIMWMYFFWEVTTLCSFLLISHDGNDQSIKNATRALILNLFGGVAFIFGIILIYQTTHTLSIQDIVAAGQKGELTVVFSIGLGLLCLAGFTKSAQFPFQSWLLGAMVAPTPVSALLHSSTMVKAGVYLVVRLAPAFSGTRLGSLVAVIGGFTFLAGSAIAISQSNGKRVLAYSTIANLGLIVCCAGIGTNIALGAAILLIIYHAISKGLLFLCVGTVEQGIGSRDIEDMQGLMKRMPFTAVIMVIGMISMLLPPFGVLITKWLAIEAAVFMPVVLLCIVLGSAFTVVFWSKWIGIVLTMSYKKEYKVEKLPISMKSSLLFLISAMFAASILILPLFNTVVQPQLSAMNLADKTVLSGGSASISLFAGNDSLVGAFASLPFFAIIFAVLILIAYLLKHTRKEAIKAPYLCGANTDDLRGIEFIGPGDKVENVIVHNYYMAGLFGENNMTLWVNLLAGALILIMFGVVIP